MKLLGKALGELEPTSRNWQRWILSLVYTFHSTQGSMATRGERSPQISRVLLPKIVSTLRQYVSSVEKVFPVTKDEL